MKEYRVESLTIAVGGGRHIDEAKRLACMAALEHCCNVDFVHNDRLYRVLFVDTLGLVKEQESRR